MARYSQCWVARTMFFLILYFRSVESETAISDWMSITLINLWIKIPSIMIHLAIVLSYISLFFVFFPCRVENFVNQNQFITKKETDGSAISALD